MDYKINPVKAAVMAHKNGDCDIVDMNNTCFSVCAAYDGAANAWTVSDACANQCNDMVERLRVSQYGLTKCDHQRPDRPALWNQVPHYFPQIFDKVRDVSKALKICNDQCCGERLPEECKRNCRIDSYAVNDSVVKGKAMALANKRMADKTNDTLRAREKAHPTSFWIAYTIAFVAFMLLVFAAARGILQR